MAAGDQTFHFGHLLSGLPLLGVRGTLSFGQLLFHLLSRGGRGSFEGLLNVGNLEGDRELGCSAPTCQKLTSCSCNNRGHSAKKPEPSARRPEIIFRNLHKGRMSRGYSQKIHGNESSRKVEQMMFSWLKTGNKPSGRGPFGKKVQQSR